MNALDIINGEDFKKCEAFHGHICPGLSIGYRAAKAGLDWLKENRSKDEEIVAIVETDACSADAVQVLTGCTFGKGNLIYKDYGKLALSLLSRNSGRGVRIVIKNDAILPNDKHMALIQKMISGEMTDAEQDRFQQLHYNRSCMILEAAQDELFIINETSLKLPPKALIEPSVPCPKCGELVMKSKLEKVGWQVLCRGCIETLGH